MNLHKQMIIQQNNELKINDISLIFRSKGPKVILGFFVFILFYLLEINANFASKNVIKITQFLKS